MQAVDYKIIVKYKTEPGPKATSTKIWCEVRPSGFRVMRADTQTDKSYGTMRHVRSGKNTRDTPSASAAEAAA